MAVGCATSTVRGFVLRFRAAEDAEADARAGIFQQFIAPDGSQCDVPDPRRQHDNPCKPTPVQTSWTGLTSALWQGGQEALMMAYDVVTLVYTMDNTNDLRL